VLAFARDRRQAAVGPPLRLAWLLPALLAAWLAAPIVGSLLDLWRSDPSLSHGPLIPVLAGGLLWMRRKALLDRQPASGWAAAALFATAVLFVAAVWADVYFLKPLSLIGMGGAAIWLLAGARTAWNCLGALAFLVFMIPWPTTISERLAFPLQMTSSAYAAMLSGMIGLPIERVGIHLHVMPNPDAPPVYSILVARQCSGLTSLVVLLALGYLIAYFTPVKLGWRALLVSLVLPITLFANALRLTLILVAGAYHSRELARWVHDHEAPVLVLLCSLGLLGARAALMAWLNRAPAQDGDPHDSIAAPLPAAGA
jgi:exosortase